MRVSFIGLFTIIGLCCLNAQEITVSEDIFLKTDYSYNLLGKVGENILLFRDKVNKVEVLAMDEKLRLRWERELTFEKKKVDIIAVIPADSLFHLIYGFKAKGDYFVRHHKYDETVTMIDSSLVALYENQYFSPRFRFARSQDRSKAIFFRTDKEQEVDVISYDLVRNGALWTRQMQFKGGHLRRDFRNIVTSNRGDMVMILDHEKQSRRNRAFEVLEIRTGTGRLVKHEVDMGDKWAYDVYGEFDNMNGQLLIAGLYNDKNGDRAKGLYFSFLRSGEYDQTVRTISFDQDLLQEVYGKEVSSKKGLSNFTMQDIVLRQDGGAVMIAEMNKEYSRRPNVPIRRDYNSYSRGAWVDYYYEDVLVFAIHADGSEHWKTVLHKRQYSQDDDAMYSSFFLFNTSRKLRLLFNDEIRQENTISEYIIRGSGTHERNSLFSTDYQRLRLRFRDAVQIAWNECIVPSERNNRLNLVRIRYDN